MESKRKSAGLAGTVGSRPAKELRPAVKVHGMGSLPPISHAGCLQRMKSTMQLHRIVEACLGFLG